MEQAAVYGARIYVHVVNMSRAAVYQAQLRLEAHIESVIHDLKAAGTDNAILQNLCNLQGISIMLSKLFYSIEGNIKHIPFVMHIGNIGTGFRAREVYACADDQVIHEGWYNFPKPKVGELLLKEQAANDVAIVPELQWPPRIHAWFYDRLGPGQLALVLFKVAIWARENKPYNIEKLPSFNIQELIGFLRYFSRSKSEKKLATQLPPRNSQTSPSRPSGNVSTRLMLAPPLSNGHANVHLKANANEAVTRRRDGAKLHSTVQDKENNTPALPARSQDSRKLVRLSEPKNSAPSGSPIHNNMQQDPRAVTSGSQNDEIDEFHGTDDIDDTVQHSDGLPSWMIKRSAILFPRTPSGQSRRLVSGRQRHVVRLSKEVETIQYKQRKLRARVDNRHVTLNEVKQERRKLKEEGRKLQARNDKDENMIQRNSAREQEMFQDIWRSCGADDDKN